MKPGDETQATVSMSDEALDCRGAHLFPRFSAYASRLADAVIRNDGRRTSMKFTDPCPGNCGVIREIEFAIPSMSVVKRALKYPKDDDGNELYLLPKQFRGSGRLSREEIRVAQVARAVQAKKARGRAKKAPAASFKAASQ